MDLRICHSECQRPGKEQPSCPSQLLMDVKHFYALVGSREFQLFKIIDKDRHKQSLSTSENTFLQKQLSRFN